jgi:kynureninase
MPEQQYADDTSRFGGGTLAIAPLYQARAGAELIGQVGSTSIRRKSLRQTAHLLQRARDAGYKINSPTEEARRGGTVVFDFAHADKVCAELNRRKFFCDHRPGGGLRVSPHFYTSDGELDRFMDEVATLRKSL